MRKRCQRLKDLTAFGFIKHFTNKHNLSDIISDPDPESRFFGKEWNLYSKDLAGF